MLSTECEETTPPFQLLKVRRGLLWKTILYHEMVEHVNVSPTLPRVEEKKKIMCGVTYILVRQQTVANERQKPSSEVIREGKQTRVNSRTAFTAGAFIFYFFIVLLLK